MLLLVQGFADRPCLLVTHTQSAPVSLPCGPRLCRLCHFSNGELVGSHNFFVPSMIPKDYDEC